MCVCDACVYANIGGSKRKRNVGAVVADCAGFTAFYHPFRDLKGSFVVAAFRCRCA